MFHLAEYVGKHLVHIAYLLRSIEVFIKFIEVFIKFMHHISSAGKPPLETFFLVETVLCLRLKMTNVWAKVHYHSNAHEIIHDVAHSEQSGSMFKLDYEKA